MRSRFEPITEQAIRDAVLDGWGLKLVELRYLPEGGGAYHWAGCTRAGSRWFVTIDDLDTKPWLGGDRDSVFNGLVACYRAAMDLRVSGSSFVVAPEATSSGAAAERVDERHSVCVFEYVDGEHGQWGQALSPGALNGLVAMLAQLHLSVVTPRGLARRGLEVPGRHGLEAALTELGHVWDGGPLSELARRELTLHAEVVQDWFTDLDRSATVLAEHAAATVLTHGEPHPGNLIHTRAGMVLVDWDTVALAPPERDLWMIATTGDDALTDYRMLTGITPSDAAISAYRLLWALSDVAAFIIQLRREHRHDADAQKALDAMRRIFDGREPSPYGSIGRTAR